VKIWLNLFLHATQSELLLPCFEDFPSWFSEIVFDFIISVIRLASLDVGFPLNKHVSDYLVFCLCEEYEELQDSV